MKNSAATKNIIFGLLAQAAAMVCGFIVPKVMIQTFGSDVNGLVASIAQFLSYITLMEAGIGPVAKAALYKAFASKNKRDIGNIVKASERFFRTIAKVFLIYLVVLTLVYPIFVNSDFDYIFSASLVAIMAISTLAEYFFGMAYRLYLQAEQKGYIPSILQIIVYILTTTATVALAYVGASIHIIKLVAGIIFIIRPIAQYLYVKKEANLDFSCVDKHYKLEQRWDGLAQHVAAVVRDNTDVVVLTIFASLTDVSIYAIYALVLRGISVIIDSIVTAVSPTFGLMFAEKSKRLSRNFAIFETAYHTIIAVIFSCTILLIVPFVSVYTANVTDANYIQPTFALVFCLAYFVSNIRLPYNSIILAAGYFKEIRKGAWIEAVINVVSSIILVHFLGLIGVAIGTLLAIFMRAIEFIYYANKHIIKNGSGKTVVKIFVLISETIIINFLVTHFIKAPEMHSYLNWIIFAVKVFSVSLGVVLPVNVLLFKKDFCDLAKRFRRVET